MEHISDHMKEIMTTGGSQHGLTMGKSCLTSLIAFCDQITRFMDERRDVDAFHLDFSKAFDIVSHNTVCELGH